MSKTEKEWKFIFKEDENYQQVIKEIQRNPQIKRIGILQWFISGDMENDDYERIRLEISREKDSYRHIWTYCKKEKPKNDHQEFHAHIDRNETEFTLDMNNPCEPKSEFISKPTYLKIEKVKENLSALKQYPAVYKIRYFFLEGDYEFILDQLIPIGGYQYQENISHIIEIEEKKGGAEFNLQAIINDSFVSFEVDDLVKKTEGNEEQFEQLKNKAIANKAYSSANKTDIPSPQKTIGYIENKLLGPVAVLAMQGKSAENFKNDIENFEKETGHKKSKDYAIYYNYSFKYTNKQGGKQ